MLLLKASYNNYISVLNYFKREIFYNYQKKFFELIQIIEYFRHKYENLA